MKTELSNPDERILEVMNDLEFFSDFPESGKRDLASICTVKTYNKDDLVIREGEVDEGIYILLEGSLKVYKNKVLVGSLDQKGTLVGEIGFTSEDHVRSAMVVARDETRLLSFDPHYLKEILGMNAPSILLTCLTKIAKNNITKIETTNQNIARLVEKRYSLKQQLPSP